MDTILLYFLLFIIYAFLGWCIEIVVCGIPAKKFINRGFLIGPYCPIYGYAGIAMTLLLQQYSNDLITLFILSAVICTFIEYITSYAMEKLFHARWWDYSDKKFNINGRVCLINSIYFGILGCLVIHLVSPFFISILSRLPSIALNITSYSLFAIFVTDNIISFNVISKFKFASELPSKDNTEEITEKIKQALSQTSFLSERLLNAYPNMKTILLKKKEEFKKFMDTTEEDFRKAIDKKNAELKELQEDFENFLNKKQVKLKELFNKDDGNGKN